MTTISAKRPHLTDGTNVNLRTVTKYAKEATTALEQAGETEAAHYFEMFYEYLLRDVANGKPFGFTYKSLGL
jgi:predicted MarR family transcription regulator